MPSNLPPGVSVNDIPGNRPEDIEDDIFMEKVEKVFAEQYPNYQAAVEKLNMSIPVERLVEPLIIEEIFTGYAFAAREVALQHALDIAQSVDDALEASSGCERHRGAPHHLCVPCALAEEDQ